MGIYISDADETSSKLKKTIKKTMQSSFTFTSTSSSKSSSSYEVSRNMRATSEVSTPEFYTSLSTDLGRLSREFYTPEPISRTGNYWPRYRCTGSTETGSCHVSYLARPFYFYNVPSKYGFSKYCTVRKL